MANSVIQFNLPLGQEQPAISTKENTSARYFELETEQRKAA